MNPYKTVNKIIESATEIINTHSMNKESQFTTLVLLEQAADSARSIINPPSEWKRKLFHKTTEKKLNVLRTNISEFSKSLPPAKKLELLSRLGRSLQSNFSS